MIGRKYRAVCPDGKVRTATITGEPTTVWTVPARVSAHGRTVSGFVTAAEHKGDAELARMLGPEEEAALETGAEYVFWPYIHRRNGALLGEWRVT